mmetsp:Transcript_55608/g.118425  ORF Transcript_55608/g.118425 Transcript_55608/m.118425 type:complete len:250 (-) Transcript_55608:38-787(-)
MAMDTGTSMSMGPAVVAKPQKQVTLATGTLKMLMHMAKHTVTATPKRDMHMQLMVTMAAKATATVERNMDTRLMGTMPTRATVMVKKAMHTRLMTTTPAKATVMGKKAMRTRPMTTMRMVMHTRLTVMRTRRMAIRMRAKMDAVAVMATVRRATATKHMNMLEQRTLMRPTSTRALKAMPTAMMHMPTRLMMVRIVVEVMAMVGMRVTVLESTDMAMEMDMVIETVLVSKTKQCWTLSLSSNLVSRCPN